MCPRCRPRRYTRSPPPPPLMPFNMMRNSEDLASVKIYEMVIFKDTSGDWSNPTTYSIPIDIQNVSDLVNSTAMQKMRLLSHEQLAFLSTYTASRNTQLSLTWARMEEDRIAKEAKELAEVIACDEERRLKLQARIAERKADRLPSMPLEESVMVINDAKDAQPETNVPTALPRGRFSSRTHTRARIDYSSSRSPSPLPPLPRHRRSESPYYYRARAGDKSEELESEWTLHSIDFDIEPVTVLRTINRDRIYYNRNTTADLELEPEPAKISVKSKEPSDRSKTEFTVVYSRWACARKDGRRSELPSGVRNYSEPCVSYYDDFHGQDTQVMEVRKPVEKNIATEEKDELLEDKKEAVDEKNDKAEGKKITQDADNINAVPEIDAGVFFETVG